MNTDDDLDAGRPFTTARWLAAGLPAEDLQDRRLRRLLRGVYVATAVPLTPALMVQAAQQHHPDAFAAGHTAARLLGGIVPHLPHVTIGLDSGAKSRRSEIRVRRYAARPALVLRDGVLCTDAAQTFADLAGELTLVDLVTLGDSLSQAGATTADDLRAALATTRGNHVRAARRAAAYVRDRVESAQETRSRLLVVLAGLPEPQTNLPVLCSAGGFYRLDLPWIEVKAALEYDGEHHDDPLQREADQRRLAELTDDGWRIEVLRSPDIFRTPDRTLERVVDLLGRAGLDVRVRSPAWRTHFPVRGSYLTE